MKKIVVVFKGIVLLAVSIIFCFIRFYDFYTTETPPLGSMRTAMTMENGRTIFLVFEPNYLNWVLFAFFLLLAVFEFFSIPQAVKKILPNGMKGR